MANRVFPYLKTTAPTVNDDTGDGYKVGDIWLDTTNDIIYQVIDVTAGAAVWRKYVSAPASATSGNIVTFNGTSGSLIQDGGKALPSGSIVGTTDTQTLTNKRSIPRPGETTSSATPTINTDNYDFYHLTAQAVDITSFTTNLSGTPTTDQRLHIAITGTAARAITWGSSFEAGAVALPTTTTTTQRLDVLFVWNAVTSKWRCMASGSA